MRTTLDVDDDTLAAVKELARRERKTAGKFVSELMREALRTRTRGEVAVHSREQFGFRPISAGGNVVTDELVNDLRKELGV